MIRWTEPDALDQEWKDALLGPGAIFELVDEQVLGAAVPVFAQRPRSLPEVLARAAAAQGDRPFLIGPSTTVTFAEAPELAERIALGLRDAFGVAPGDRVALAGGVSVDHAMVLWGLAAAGAVAATLNPSWTTTELGRALEVAAPVLVVGDDRVLARLADAVADRSGSGDAPAPAVASFSQVVAAAPPPSDPTCR